MQALCKLCLDQDVATNVESPDDSAVSTNIKSQDSSSMVQPLRTDAGDEVYIRTRQMSYPAQPHWAEIWATHEQRQRAGGQLVPGLSSVVAQVSSNASAALQAMLLDLIQQQQLSKRELEGAKCSETWRCINC